jgi:hypothetical protein
LIHESEEEPLELNKEEQFATTPSPFPSSIFEKFPDIMLSAESSKDILSQEDEQETTLDWLKYFEDNEEFKYEEKAPLT